MSNTTVTLDTTDAAAIGAEGTAPAHLAEGAPSSAPARRPRRPIRWLLAVLTIVAAGLGTLAVTGQVASAAPGTATARICWSDQYGPLMNGKVRAIIALPNGRTWVADEATTNSNGCAAVRFTTERHVRFTVQKSTGDCRFYCIVSTGNTGWLSAYGTAPNRTYNLGPYRATSTTINSGYQNAMHVLNNI